MFKQVGQWIHTHRLELAVTALSVALLFVSALPYILVTIDAGLTGVLWRRFFGGTELQENWKEGTAVVFPWDKMAIYDLRLQRISETFNTLSNNGLEVHVSVSVRFRPLEKNITRLHKYVGSNYIDVLLVPEMGAHVRKVISSYSPEQLYSLKRDVIQDQILDSIRNELAVFAHGEEEKEYLVRDYVFLDDVLVTSIVLPEAVRTSIEFKEQAKQLSYAYDHKLDIEKKEKIRKRIEAEGIRDFQNTITQGISEKYLRWEGIRATLKLASSNNSKVVVIGGGGQGLPIILGGDYTATTGENTETLADHERHADPESHSYGPVKLPVSGKSGSDQAEPMQATPLEPSLELPKLEAPKLPSSLTHQIGR